MAKNKGNQVMSKMRGMFGKQVVFKERLGTEYVAAPPNVNENRIPTKREKSNQLNFAEAVEYGQGVVRDPELKKVYATLVKQGQTAYNVAISDARVPPKINSLLVQGYTGQIGSCILVQATDNIKVQRVQVTICDSNMTMVEQGEATDNGDNSNWIYTATVSNNHTEGCIVEARAYDMPGNVTIESTIVPVGT